MSRCSQVSHTGRIQRRADRIRCPPDHPGAATRIQDGLLIDLVSSLVSERSGRDEDDLVLPAAAPLEMFSSTPASWTAVERLPDLLAEFAVDCVQGVLAELDMTAERPVKQLPRRVRFLRYQQRAITWPPDQHHRLNALTPGFHRYVVSRLAGAPHNPRPDRSTVSLGIRQIGVSDRTDLGTRRTFSDRYGPCDTRANGPPANGPWPDGSAGGWPKGGLHFVVWADTGPGARSPYTSPTGTRP